MRIRKSAVRAVLITSAAMAVLPCVARAEAADDTAGAQADITVIGQRQQYRGDVPLKELPQSVQEIDGKMLAQLNITRLDAALDLASGVARQNNFGGLWDSFAIRGFAGDENFPSGFLVNGFNGGRGYGGPRDASNIEKIEVLKGPNGAVFGRGEPGGTINITTKKAKIGDTFGSFAASGGSFDTYRVEGDYNVSVTDTVAIRLNGAMQEADSFRNTVSSRKKVASPSIVFQPTSKTSLSYEMEFVDQDVDFDRGVVAVDGKLGVMDRSTFLGEPGDGPTKVKVLGHQVQLQQDLGHGWALLGGFGYRDTSFKGYSSDPELAASRQTLEETGNILSRQRRFRDYRTTNMVFRGEISGKFYTGPFTHHVLVGADWDKFKINLDQTRYRGPVYTAGSPITADNYAIDIFNPVYGQVVTPTTVLQDSHEVQSSWGVYFQDQIDITDHFKVRVGGRFDHFKQDVTNYIKAATDPLYRKVAIRKRFSPTAGALYELTDTLSIYGGYGTGFRPNSGLNFFGETFAPETSKSYEAGLRFTSIDKRISATVAAYSMKKKNILTNDPDPNHSGFSVAGGSATSKGIEADFNANLPGDITIYATYAYTDAKWAEAAADAAFGLAINKGDPLINIPKHQGNLLVTKAFDLGDAGRATIGGGVTYVSKRLGETGSTFYLPDYTLTRALVSYEPEQNIKLSVDVTNLFDVTWYAASYHRYWVMPGTPRTITGRVEFKF